MDAPNFFDYGSNERCHDAFWGWLLSWLTVEVQPETEQAWLQDTAREFFVKAFASPRRAADLSQAIEIGPKQGKKRGVEYSLKQLPNPEAVEEQKLRNLHVHKVRTQYHNREPVKLFV